MQARLSELDKQAGDSDIWNDPDVAKTVMQERSNLEAELSKFNGIVNELNDCVMLIELGESEGDEQAVLEAENDLMKLAEKVNKYRLESLLSGEADSNDAYLEIHAGAGGTEAQDWAEMLLRMYSRWAENHGYSLELIEESVGDEAGLKSVTIKIGGLRAYGWLKAESGVHRLVRISPFDSNARRHTSFASVWVYPVVDDKIEVEIRESDLRIDTYRASGAGGQHVNKTESAIRITHIPTGIVVSSQVDRSQHRNRAIAFDMLRARLYELELRKREQEANSMEASKGEIGWGNQIRSYVLQPYQMVKDLRTNFEVGNAHSVLDGNIDGFLESSIANKCSNG